MGDSDININLKQKEKLKKIGDYLQQVRVKKGISLETVASQTLIPHRLLTAIEEGKIEELPEPFYIRALITKFARTIEAKEIDLTDITKTQEDLPATSKESTSRWYFPNFQIRSVHLYLIYLLIIGVSIKGITTLVERPIVNNIIQVEKQIPIESPVTISSPSLEEKQSTTLGSKSTTPQSAVVSVTLKDKCWLRVIVDGKTEFEGTLPKGTNRTWTGKEQVTIRAGNAGGVFITFNEEQEKLLGKPGEVEEVTYTVN